MILSAYRHGLRASELCNLRWDQIDLGSGRLHVPRAKGGIERAQRRNLALGQPIDRCSTLAALSPKLALSVTSLRQTIMSLLVQQWTLIGTGTECIGSE